MAAYRAFMTHVACRLTAKYQISSETLCSVIGYGLPFTFLSFCN